MIYIGDKVVCVDVSKLNPNNRKPNGVIQFGCVYVVGGFYVDEAGDLGLLIVGKPSLFILDGEDVGWHVRRFRKLEYYKREQELEYYRSEPARTGQWIESAQRRPKVP